MDPDGRIGDLPPEVASAATTSPIDAPAAPPTRDPTVALTTEYNILVSAITATWSIAMTRVSLLLGVLSAGFVALTIAAQAVGFGNDFYTMALILLPLPLFLGLVTFVRLIQVNREVTVYIVGMNRIRRALAQEAPSVVRYLVLPIHDDVESIHRSPGGGMTRRRPRFRLIYAFVQVPGLVAVVDGSVAAGLALVVATLLGLTTPAIVAITAVTFLVTVAILLFTWRRSMAELEASLAPEFPTPADAVDRPIGDAGRL